MLPETGIMVVGFFFQLTMFSNRKKQEVQEICFTVKYNNDYLTTFE